MVRIYSNENTQKTESQAGDTVKTDMKQENNLEMHHLRGKEKRTARRAQMQERTDGLSAKEKIFYYIYYYKWHFLVAVITIAAVISLIVSLYMRNKPVALSYAIINCNDVDSLDFSVIENDYMDYYGFDSSYQIKNIYTIHYNLETSEEDYSTNPDDISYTTFPTLCDQDYFDIIITDATGLKYCAVKGLIFPLDTALASDLYTRITEDYKDLIVKVPDDDDALTEFAINISDTSFAKSLGLDYDDVYLCFPGDSKDNAANIRRILNFIFEWNLPD